MGVCGRRRRYPQSRTQHRYRLPRSLGRDCTVTRRVSGGSDLPSCMGRKRDMRRKRCWRVFGGYGGRTPRRCRHHPRSPRRPRNNRPPSLPRSLRPLGPLPLQRLPAVVAAAGRRRQVVVVGADAPNRPLHPHPHRPCPLLRPYPPPLPRSPNW